MKSFKNFIFFLFLSVISLSFGTDFLGLDHFKVSENPFHQTDKIEELEARTFQSRTHSSRKISLHSGQFYFTSPTTQNFNLDVKIIASIQSLLPIHWALLSYLHLLQLF